LIKAIRLAGSVRNSRFKSRPWRRGFEGIFLKPINQTNFIAYPHQKASLDSRRDHDLIVNCLGFELVILPDVYATNLDTELMGKTVKIRKNKDFLEIGAGSGAVAIYVSRRARKGVAVDSSPAAVRNICLNVRRAGIKNLEVIKSNLFSNVKGKFDVIIFNPPYSNYKARSLHDRMFWDPGNRSKKLFLQRRQSF